MPVDTASGIYYEVHGRGEPLFLGFPVFASGHEIDAAMGRMRDGYLQRFTDRYRVLVADYPSLGRSAGMPPLEFTAERACADMLSVADAAGFDRFAWFGYSLGAAIGLQLATRTDRLTALVAAGWAPLGGLYAAMGRAAMVNIDNPPDYALRVLRNPAQYRQWSTFWNSLADWPEAAAVPRIRCPRLALAGSAAVADGGGMIIPYGQVLAERRSELEALGWEVTLLEGRSHEDCVDPAVVLPQVRRFLDRVLPAPRAHAAP